MMRGRRVVAGIVLLGLPMMRAASSGSPGDDSDSKNPVIFDQLPVVEAATLHSQTLQEAPASVNIITAEEIRRYGYRTLAEVLAGVRGFYMSYDREYWSAGLRGFSLPGDYNTRFLVMINGHNLTENIYGSNDYFGQDFGLDLALISRIEIVRGPSSALYGSNGIFATINIVTRSPVDQPGTRVNAEMGSFGERKLSASTSHYLGHAVNLLVSASVFDYGGQTLYFPAFDSPATNNGLAAGVDGEKGYHTFANLVWQNWSFTAYFNARQENLPAAPYGTLFNDRGTKDLDSRNFVEASYAGDLGPRGHLRFRAYYDRYVYQGRFDYADGLGIEDNRDTGKGDWLGTQLTYRVDISPANSLTAGLDFRGDIRALQINRDVSPAFQEFLNIDDPTRSAAVFGQYEFRLASRWKAYIGVRVDKTWGFDPVASPRAALIYQYSPNTVVKVLYGRAFRDPTSYERYYDDHGYSQMSNPRLLPEKAQTVEVVLEKKLGDRLSAVVDPYFYSVRDLIQAVPVGSVIQFQNATATRAGGIGFELSGHPWRSLEVATGFSLDRADNVSADARLVNSPGKILQIRASAPLARGKLILSGASRYLADRATLDGGIVPGYGVSDLTLSTAHLHRDFDIQAGVRNLFDRRYLDPAGYGDQMAALAQDGRSFFVNLVWTHGQ